MSEWLPGPPPNTGSKLFWFDPGFERIRGMPLIYGHGYVNGRHGSMPLSMVYSEKSCPRARHMAIEPPDSYGGFRTLNHTGGDSACWIKQYKHDGAVGILIFGMAFGMHGSIIWLNHPNTCTESGVNIDTEKFRFSVLEIPT